MITARHFHFCSSDQKTLLQNADHHLHTSVCTVAYGIFSCLEIVPKEELDLQWQKGTVS